MSNETEDAKKVLVIYYSLTGNTKRIAEIIQKKTGDDVFEIEMGAALLERRPDSVPLSCCASETIA